MGPSYDRCLRLREALRVVGICSHVCPEDASTVVFEMQRHPYKSSSLKEAGVSLLPDDAFNRSRRSRMVGYVGVHNHMVYLDRISSRYPPVLTPWALETEQRF